MPLLRLRFVALIAVVSAAGGSLLMFYLGAVKTVKAYRIYFLGEPLTADPAPPQHLDVPEQTMIAIIESMDAFLVALVLLIFGGGIYGLFIGRLPAGHATSPWLSITTIGRLKQVVVEVVLVILAVLFLRQVLFLGENIAWPSLAIPVGMVLLAASLKLVSWRDH